ncbi:MAG: EB domain-containing protein [Myxococcota bacterium]
MLILSVLLLLTTGCMGPTDRVEPDSTNPPTAETSSSTGDTGDTGECRVDEDCGEHAQCLSVDNGGTVCDCVAGYSPINGTCTFSGILRAPEVDDADVWQTTGEAVVDPKSVGDLDPGVANWTREAILAGSRVWQDVQMPPVELSEALGVDVRIQVLPQFDPPRPFPLPAHARIGTGGALQRMQLVDGSLQFETYRACLGPSAYGGTVRFEVVGDRFAVAEAMVLDRFDILTAAELGLDCPAPGSVQDGGFEGTGWTVLDQLGGTTTIEPGAGTRETVGVRFTADTTCSQLRVEGMASWPAEPGYALQFAVQGTSERPLIIEAEPSSIAAVDVPPTFETRRVCLPAATRGWVQPIQVGLRSVDSFFEPCGPGDEVLVDDLEVVKALECTGETFSDHGFELVEQGLEPGWILDGTRLATAAEVTDLPRTGKASLLLEVDRRCDSASATTPVRLPQSTNDAGPALKFWHRGSIGNAEFRVSNTVVQPESDWGQTTICFRPEFADQVYALSFGLSSAGDCSQTFPAEQIYIDDVELTTDVSCPR